MVSTDLLWEIGILLAIIANVIPILYYLIINFYSRDNEKKMNINFQPPVTIFLPVKNESLLIEDKLREVLDMTYEQNNISILIIDSHSNDDTAEIAKTFLKKFANGIKWKVIEAKRFGKTSAVNDAIEIIKTDYMIMMDAEAILHPRCLVDIIGYFEDPEIGAVCGQIKVNKNDPDYHYRERFNHLRTSESFIDSTPIFEGSICGFRLKSIGEDRLDENINADDSQLAIIVRKNGFKSLMKSHIKFIEAVPNKQSRKKRSLRRSQGLIRVLWKHKKMTFLNFRYGAIYMNNIYFYILMPWIMFFSFVLVSFSFSLDIMKNQNIDFTFEIYVDILLIALTVISRFIREYIYGLWTLAKAQVYLIRGKQLNIWETDYSIRKEIKNIRN